MKKVIVLCFAVVMFFIPAFLFATKCDSEGEGYFIKFTLEEQEYILSFGFTDVGTGEPYTVLHPGITNGDMIAFFGSNVETDFAFVREDLDNVIDMKGRLFPHTPGVYEDDYDVAQNTINSYGEVMINVIENSQDYPYRATSGIITITSFGAVGEPVEGTFDLTFTLWLPAGDSFAPLFGADSYDITGSFRVKRVAVEDIPETF